MGFGGGGKRGCCDNIVWFLGFAVNNVLGMLDLEGRCKIWRDAVINVLGLRFWRNYVLDVQRL